MDGAILENLIWNGRAQKKTQTFGFGSQFILPIGENNTGIITKLVFSPFSFQPGTDGDFITAPLQEIILSDGRRSISKAIKNFESGVIKSDTNFISQGQSIATGLYFPFFADAPLYINLNQNNIAVQLGSPFNQIIREDINPGFKIILQAAINNGDSIPSIEQQYWLNLLYEVVKPYFDANRIYIFVNGRHDSGSINFSLYDWANPGTKYQFAGSPSTFYQINRGSNSGGSTGNFGFNGVAVPANNPRWQQYRAAYFPRGLFISGNSINGIQIGTNRNGAFAEEFLRGWNQTLGTLSDMNRDNPNPGNCQTLNFQQREAPPIVNYYSDGVFVDNVTQPPNQPIPVNEQFLLFGRQGQNENAPTNAVQFLHNGLSNADNLEISNAVKSFCANLGNPAPRPSVPTGIIQAFITVHYYEIQGNVLSHL